MAVHGPANVEEDQDADLVAPFRAQLDVQIALLGRALDRAVQVKLFGRAIPGPLAQAAEGDLDVAGAQFDGVVEVLVFALVPDLDGLAVAALVLADPDALGVIAVGAEG